jgi:hypothetical protein
MTRGFGSDARPSATQRLGRWLVSWYPSPWRARYEDEVAVLLEDSRVRWRDVADLARGLVVERARALIEPADSPLRTRFLMLGATSLALLTLTFTAWGLGQVARALTGPLPLRLATGDALILAAMAGAIVPALVRLLRNPGNLAAFLVRGKPYWLAAMLVGIGLAAWAGRQFDVVETFCWSMYLGMLLPNRWEPWRRARAALAQEAAAQHELKWALMELARCENLEAEGTPAPLVEARANVARIQSLREEALATLRALGYRARFH